MKKSLLKDVVVLLVMLAVVAVICRFLPDQVPIHINAQGEIDMYANKWFLLLGTAIPYSVYLQFSVIEKSKCQEVPCKVLRGTSL